MKKRKSGNGKDYTGKSGTTIEILMKLTEKFKKETSITNNGKITKKRKIIKTSQLELGKLETSDRENLAMGFHVLERIINEGYDVLNRELLAGKNDVGRLKKEIAGYRAVMQDAIRRISIGARNEYELQKRIELLPDYYQIAQAARDGVIIKQEKRTEIIDGEKKEVVYDTSMTEKEVLSTFNEYERELERVRFNKLNNYLGLGLGIASTIGGIINSNKNKDSQDKGTATLITVGTTAISALKLIQGVLKQGDREELWKIRDKGFRLRDDLLTNEQVRELQQVQ